MERKFTIVLALALLVVSGSESWAMMYEEGTTLPPSDYGILGTAWDPGANTASFITAPDYRPVGPGGATFSIMGAGFKATYGYGVVGGHSGSSKTAAITALAVSSYNAASYEADISSALDVWAVVSLFTNLGLVADGAVNAAASEASDGHLGDIRVAAWEIAASGVLAHAYQPSIDGMFLGGTIGGDMHFDVARTWVDDPWDDNLGPADFDFFTVALHELGHSLGLDHSGVVGSVMYPVYGGALRTLTADDIEGIQAIYGVPVPGAILLGMLGLSVAGWKLRRFA